jgi:hypothetical protein
LRQPQRRQSLSSPKKLDGAEARILAGGEAQSGAGTLDAGGPPKDDNYWEQRARAVYFQHIYALVHFLAPDAKSIIDVGSNGCPYIEWFSWIPSKVSVDLRKPYSSRTVHGVKTDFLSFPLEKRFDFCTCLQVLEHIPDVDLFARKLLATSTRVLISVPYKWPSGKCKWHVHDPVDEEKVASWFGTEPIFSMVSKEFDGTPRLICYFCSAPSLTGRRDHQTSSHNQN